MTERTNPIIDILQGCQNGQLIDTLGAACDLSEAECRQSLERLTPDIAKRIGERVSDEEDYEDLIDILDEEDQVEILDDPNAMFKRDTIEDGEDILELLYGSMDKARAAARQIGAPRGVDVEVFERLMTMAATLTFSAMARRNQIYQMSAMSESGVESDDQSPGGDGLISTLFSAIVTGFMQGFRQATRRKRRRRRKRSMLEQIFGASKTTRRRTTRSRKRRRRRRKTPSITDLIGDIFD